MTYRKVVVELDKAHSALHAHPTDLIAIEIENKISEEFVKAQDMYLSFLKHKVKYMWLLYGNQNTADLQNRVYALHDCRCPSKCAYINML